MKTATVTTRLPDGKTTIWTFNPAIHTSLDLIVADILGVIRHGAVVTIEPSPETKPQ